MYLQGDLVAAFADWQRVAWSGEYKVALTLELKVVLGQYEESYKAYRQQDAHEFLLYLLDKLGEEVAPTSSGDNAVSRWFRGQSRVSVTCTNCGAASVTHEPMMCLSVPVRLSLSCLIAMSGNAFSL